MSFNLAQIAQLRVHHQHIDQPLLKQPSEIVSYLGAVQAQDYDMCKWSLALRLKDVKEDIIETAINNGSIIRSHILRPTWHLVSQQDYDWMLDLSAPQLRRVSKSYNKEVDLDETTLNKAMRIIEKLLVSGDHLTREEIMIELSKKKINCDSYRAAHIMFHAELNGIVVNGKRKDKQLTYALYDHRIQSSKKLTRDEALVKLALRYFTSHAPATERDFSWWSGLNLSDCRKAILLADKRINSFHCNETSYYFTQSDLNVEKSTNLIHILPAFDELLVSYADRTPSLVAPHTRTIITVNGIFKPCILHSSQVIGSWKRVVKPSHLEIETNLFKSTSSNIKKEIKHQFKQYSWYLHDKEIRFKD